MGNLTKKDIKEINRLRSVFPASVLVQVQRSRDGGFVAEVKTFPGCFTEADTFSELIEMANDVVKTYLDVPLKYLPFMPSYMPPLSEAKRLDVFPVQDKTSQIKLEIPNREKIQC